MARLTQAECALRTDTKIYRIYTHTCTHTHTFSPCQLFLLLTTKGAKVNWNKAEGSCLLDSQRRNEHELRGKAWARRDVGVRVRGVDVL